MPLVSAPHLFDLVVVVDWSANAAAKTGADSIWVASLEVATGRLEVDNHPTRHRTEQAVAEVLTASAGQRVLLGVDFPLGYPTGSAALLGDRPFASAGGARDDRLPWQQIWDFLVDNITDDERNRNNRFDVAAQFNQRCGREPGPFWGCPPAQAGDSLGTHKRHRFPVIGSAGSVEEFRLTERRLRQAGRRPFSVWQTLYAGSVGGQALVGIPVVSRLINHPVLAGRSAVWPMMTGLTTDPTRAQPDAIVVAEVWPSLPTVDLTRHPIKDAAQVIGMCEWLAAADATGTLGPMFAPSLSDHEAATVVGEEGWILGA